MSHKADILSLSDVHKLVDSFYAKVRRDETLGLIFNQIIQDKWPEHLEKMYRFWQTVLLNEHTYSGSPFAPHVKMPIDKDHFDLWLKLFYETIDENFSGEKAVEAKWRAQKMAEMFQYKIQFYKSNPTQFIA